MKDLIQQISHKTSVTDQQAEEIIGIVASFVKAKFPMLNGTVDSILSIDDKTNPTLGRGHAYKRNWSSI